MPLALAFAAALGLALALTPLAIRLAWAIGYLDHPEARKLHTAATPLLGGAVVFVSAIVAWTLSIPTGRSGPLPEAMALLAGAGIALVTGLIDDRVGLGVVPKLLGQAAAATILLASGNLPDFGLPKALEVTLAVIVLVALMNAINFLDNMNGMVSGLAAILLAGFAWSSAERGAYGVAAAQLAIAGGCVGFLPFNFPRARIFLGDAGSLFLGYSLGASAVLAFVRLPPGWGKLGPLIALGYPAFDLIFVVVNRLREGRKIQQGGKDHSNHRLASVIACPTRTVILVWLVGAALSASSLVVQKLNRPAPALLLSGLWLVLFLWMGRRLSSVPIEAPSQPAPVRS